MFNPLNQNSQWSRKQSKRYRPADEAQPHKATENLITHIINLQNSVSVRTYYIDIWAFALVLRSRIPPIIRRREQADQSSCLIGVDYSCLFATGLLGGNHTSDKYRMVPPFVIKDKLWTSFQKKHLWQSAFSFQFLPMLKTVVSQHRRIWN